MKFYHIDCLKRDIEMKVGRTMKSPTDFDFLSRTITQTSRESISSSTLKRLWHYGSKEEVIPRVSTLSLLARFLGYIDWDTYRLNLLRTEESESGFLTPMSIVTASLTPGDCVEMTWNPERRCVVRYNGDHSFEVVESENAKLQPGDTFQTLSFMLGQPLQCAGLRSAAAPEATHYVAGRISGLTSLIIRPSRRTAARDKR